jgi:thiol-disulfide isomerase/thioredoxin
MSPLRKVAIGLWLTVFLLAGVRFGSDWLPGPAVNTTVDSGDDITANNQLTVSKEDSEAAVGIGDPLPTLTLTDLNGNPRAVAEWSGRTLLINFWATWCAPCRKEMPLLQQFQESRDPDRMQVIGIAIDRLDPVIRFLGETGVTYPNLVGEMDATRAAEQFAPGFALPLSIVAAPDNTVLAVHIGEIRASDLEQIATVADALATGTLSTAEAATRLKLGARPAAP